MTEEPPRASKSGVAETITRFTGSMRFLYLHIVLFGLWILVNLGVQPKSDDCGKKRAELGLQINPLAEHKVTRPIALLDRPGVKTEVGEFKEDVAPEAVLDELEHPTL